jgi:Spy/CpxP family protein refolding chaperone
MLLMHAGAIAQPRMDSPKDRAAAMKERLALSDSQTTAITKIFEASQADMKKAFDMRGGDRDSMRAMRMSMMKKVDDRIDSVLTSDQKKKYDDFRKERRGRMRDRSRND